MVQVILLFISSRLFCCWLRFVQNVLLLTFTRDDVVAPRPRDHGGGIVAACDASAELLV